MLVDNGGGHILTPADVPVATHNRKLLVLGQILSILRTKIEPAASHYSWHGDKRF